MSSEKEILLYEHNGSTIAHYAASESKNPFASSGIEITMHELSSGIIGSTISSSSPSSRIGFSGQLGIIDFTTSTRLPRHVHISSTSLPAGTTSDDVETQSTHHLTSERILVLNGVALVELNGDIYVIPPKTLVHIAAGVPHTWTACPRGIQFSDAMKENGSFTAGNSIKETESPISDGTFLMVYMYEDVTGFFPTEQTETIEDVNKYVRCDDLERIRFPQLSVEDVYEKAWFIYGTEVWKCGPR
ncbi:uncharacterized protein PAC_18650 [Phialocephala subalpina]|uniref:Uncharacterized protein n=1 Tax=Phialocephala subalpina TaxID=576137 RepID=A0A1L7XUR0_9HELO|nr:uncharacterized protein PAC_18650 [Phialocephala subalpina]